MTAPEKLTPEAVSDDTNVSPAKCAAVMDYLIQNGWMIGRFVEFGEYDFRQSERDKGVIEMDPVCSIMESLLYPPSKHPSHGVSAQCVLWAQVIGGPEITIWSQVEVDSAVYEIREDDNFSVEVRERDGGNSLIEGRAMRLREDADMCALSKMMEYRPKEDDIFGE